MKKRLFIVVVAIALSLQANTKDDLEYCSKFSIDSKRLSCYDKLANRKIIIDSGIPIAKSTPISSSSATYLPTSQNNGSTGKWNISSDTDQFSDKTTIVASLKADRGISSKYGGADIYPTLMLRCKNNSTEAFIAWDRFITTRSIMVTTRVDKQRVQNRTWVMSTDNEATFSNSAISLIRRMINHNQLLVELTPYGDSPTSTLFNIEGIGNAIKDLRKECHW